MADEIEATPAKAGKGAEPAATPTTAAERPKRKDRKVREGIVSSASMDQTVVVKVVERVRHARYAKTLQRTTKLYAQDDANECKQGDRVRLAETRPISKLKRWRVIEILERAK
jgi:small subunit ribosomal protein S17